MGAATKPIYYSKETIELLKTMLPSSEAMHKVFNPHCGRCMYERGQRMIGKDGKIHFEGNRNGD